MSTGMERTPQQPQMLTYKQLFATSDSRRAQIVKAAGRLGYMTGRVLEAPLLEGWVQNLESYEAPALAHAFERTESEVAAFPAVAHVKSILERAEFDRQFALVIRGIKRHGYKWENREAWKESDKWDYHSDEAQKLGDRIHIVGKVHPAEPAPEIPPRMQQALELFGGEDDFHAGLVRLWRDAPNFWSSDTERESGQHGRQAAQIDRDLYACWQRSAE